MKLIRTDHLRLTYDIRATRSTDPILHSGTAEIEAHDGDRLTCRFVMPAVVFGRPSTRLANFVFSYAGLGRFDGWGYAGTWVVVSLGARDPFESYFAAFNADRDGTA